MSIAIQICYLAIVIVAMPRIYVAFYRDLDQLERAHWGGGERFGLACISLWAALVWPITLAALALLWYVRRLEEGVE